VRHRLTRRSSTLPSGTTPCVRPYARADIKYLSISRPPPPPISQVLTLTLPRALTFALTSTQSTSTSLETPLPDLTPITSKLTELTAAPGLAECFTTISRSGGKIIIVTNGSKGTTEGYAETAGVRSMVHAVVSCDEVGLAKPHREVYDAALLACSEADAAGERWFVAAHAWDVCAARKAG
jgi:2-haloacid dehalogenase